jgi:hypothetical protein
MDGEGQETAAAVAPINDSHRKSSAGRNRQSGIAIRRDPESGDKQPTGRRIFSSTIISQLIGQLKWISRCLWLILSEIDPRMIGHFKAKERWRRAGAQPLIEPGERVRSLGFRGLSRHHLPPFRRLGFL